LRHPAPQTLAAMHADTAQGAAQCTRDTQVIAWRNIKEHEIEFWKLAQKDWNKAIAEDNIPEGAEPPPADPPLGAPPLCAFTFTCMG
jgi:hypothetical protein